MVSSCSSLGLVGKNKSTQGKSIIQPTGAMWSQGFNVSYNEVGARTRCQRPLGRPKGEGAASPAAVRG
jgi:hypothetical protein